MKARDIMTSRPACCTADDTLERAAHLMDAHDCGCIPVVDPADESRVTGVITDRDIAIRAISHGRSGDTRVRDVMTSAPTCVSGDASVREVENLMADRQIRRVVVVDDEGCCIGMIAQADLARAAETSSEVSDEDVAHVVEAISETTRKEWRL